MRSTRLALSARESGLKIWSKEGGSPVTDADLAVDTLLKTELIAARPDYAEGHFDRGFLLQELNDPEAAIAAFDQALKFNPDHDRALYGKALSLIGLRRHDEAIAPLEKNTKLQPFSPFGWYQLGRVQFDRGKPEKTQAIIEHLATFEPKVAAQLARETGLKPPSP